MPPNLCDTKGRLVSLSLRDAGLRCPTFPGQLAALGALQRLDLSGNDLAADVKAAAAVSAPFCNRIAAAGAASAVGRAARRGCAWSGGWFKL